MAETFLETLELSENERQEVIPICQLFHTSAKTLSERFDVGAVKLKLKCTFFFTIDILLFSNCRFLSELGRHNYVTPTSYLELIAAFRLLLTQKRDTVMNAKQRYISGLEKLAFAESQVFKYIYIHIFLSFNIQCWHTRVPPFIFHFHFHVSL